ncbi:MAG: hypothetical protein LBE59_06050 [Nevskiaceae bacterium]|jgi:hypothetical protein|nr:hypothetical protein [Nevskiaceae bacterium]
MLPRSAALSLMASLALTGCANLDGFSLRKPVAAPPAPSNEAVQTARLNVIATTQEQLVQGSPAEQAEALASARTGWEFNRQGPEALHYALALATPGHPGRDLPQAQQLLRETLARPELLSPPERAIAIVELQRVDDELRLLAEVDRLVAEIQREKERQRTANANANAARRLQTELEENARLRAALQDAQAKLDAIANIERSISDRPSTNEGRNP